MPSKGSELMGREGISSQQALKSLQCPPSRKPAMTAGRSSCDNWCFVPKRSWFAMASETLVSRLSSQASPKKPAKQQIAGPCKFFATAAHIVSIFGSSSLAQVV